MEPAEAYYCGALGFRRVAIHHGAPGRPDPAYLVLERDGVVLHLSSFPGDGAIGHVAVVLVADVEALFRELVARPARITLPPTTQTWGNREMYVADPDGNVVRFLQPLAERAVDGPGSGR